MRNIDHWEMMFALADLTCHVVATTELICKAISISIEDDATNATKCLCSQELDLGIRLIRLHQTSGMDLDPLQIDGLCTNQ